MSLLGVVLLLEIWPMITFIRWRIARSRGHVPHNANIRRLYVVNQIQLTIIALMVFVAAFMARGSGSTRG